MDDAADVFGAETKVESASPPIDVKTLYAKVGELTRTNDVLSGALTKAGCLGAKR